ncbi:hypothetical protein LC593_34435 [Nostoc sp. CHAB 5844]|nr:hypothetical protein [Nostoc sp. CHAB 5844]
MYRRRNYGAQAITAGGITRLRDENRLLRQKLEQIQQVAKEGPFRP